MVHARALVDQVTQHRTAPPARGRRVGYGHVFSRLVYENDEVEDLVSPVCENAAADKCRLFDFDTPADVAARAEAISELVAGEAARAEATSELAVLTQTEHTHEVSATRFKRGFKSFRDDDVLELALATAFENKILNEDFFASLA